MAKALIKENLGAGQYNIEIIKNTGKIQSKLSGIGAEIAALEATENKTAAIKLQILSLQKKRVQLEAIKNTTRLAWCADYQVDLEGTVGVVNMPDEPDRFVNIKPGTGSAYDEKIDGDVYPAMNMLPETAFYNRGILPGVQRWKPRYRYGTIVSTDPATDRCSVLVTPAYSSQQGLPINPESTVTMTNLGGPDTTLPGWEHFVEKNPDSEIVTNTDPGSDVKFTDNRLSQLESVNNSVNSSHRYVSDAPGSDEWELMGPGETGDCDDFTMTKMQELIDKGWPASDLHPTVCYIDQDGKSEGHSVLTVDTDRGTYVLDSRHDEVVVADDGLYQAYTWDQRLNGGSWFTIGFGPQLENVPVEYMQCGAGAFAPGDEVLISFSGSWDTPKVIGFRSMPKQCVDMCITRETVDGGYNSHVSIVNEQFEALSSVGINVSDGGCCIASAEVGGATRNLLWHCDTPAGEHGGWFVDPGTVTIYGRDARTMEPLFTGGFGVEVYYRWMSDPDVLDGPYTFTPTGIDVAYGALYSLRNRSGQAESSIFSVQSLATGAVGNLSWWGTDVGGVVACGGFVFVTTTSGATDLPGGYPPGWLTQGPPGNLHKYTPTLQQKKSVYAESGASWYRDVTTDGSVLYALRYDGVDVFDTDLNLLSSFDVPGFPGWDVSYPDFIKYYNGKLYLVSGTWWTGTRVQTGAVYGTDGVLLQYFEYGQPGDQVISDM